MNFSKYASAPLCMILCALAASSFAADNASDKPAPAAVPAAEQADYAEKQAEAAKAEADAKAAKEKIKKEAEAKAAEEQTRATAEEKKKAAEEKVAKAFDERFPELAKAIAAAELTEDRRAEIDAMSANLMASSDALEVVMSGDGDDEYTPDQLECLIEFLTQYTAILAAVPSPETEELLADKRLQLLNARELRLEQAQQDFEAGRITAGELEEIKDKYGAADDETAVSKAAKKERKEPFWGYRKHKPLPYLLIVANYRIPRKVIAEYLRTKYDVPYILLPSNPGKPSKDDQVYFSGGKKNSGELEVALPAPQLSQFIAYLRPETVIILGDDSYINPVYRLAVPENTPRKIEISNSEWKVNTLLLDDVFRKTLKTNLSDHYLEYLQNQDKPGAE